MPKVKSMVKKNLVEIAKGQRTCHHDRSRKIPKGEICLVVYDGYRDRHCYCKEVALRMITEARDQLNRIESLIANG
jgi:hypothetical protein